jgi:hypothetical protein
MAWLWAILWVLAAVLTGAVMFGAWTGPHRSVSNLSRWAARVRIRTMPVWLTDRSADRWACRGGLVVLVILAVLPWVVSSQGPQQSLQSSQPPAGAPNVIPPPGAPQPLRSGRHIDQELQNAILVHVPKTKRVRIVVLREDAEADQFSWEIDAFLRTEGYAVVSPRLMFAMKKGEQAPTGTAIYPDEKDQNIVVIRVGLDDRRP